MKTTIAALLLVCFGFNCLQAQETEDTKAYLGLSVGLAIPTGDYGDDDVSSDNSAFAQTGFLFDLSYAQKLGGGNLGITALLRVSANNIDAQKLADEFALTYPTFSWTVETTPWVVGALMVGGFGAFPISGKTTFDARLMFGFASAASPEIKIIGEQGGNELWVKQESGTGTALAILLGAGLKFDVGKSIYLLTNVDFFSTKPEFSDVKIKSSDGSSDTAGTFDQGITTLNLSVGIGFKL